MSDDWYCRSDDQEFGPMPLEELVGRVQREQIGPGDQVRQGSHGLWKTAANVVPLRLTLGEAWGDSGGDDQEGEVDDSLDADAPDETLPIPDPLAEFDIVDVLDSSEDEEAPGDEPVPALPPIPTEHAGVRWYCQTSAGERGPLVWEELERLVSTGWLAADDSVRQGESTAWVPAGHLRRLFPADSPAEDDQPAADVPGKADAEDPSALHAMTASEENDSDQATDDADILESLLQTVEDRQREFGAGEDTTTQSDSAASDERPADKNGPEPSVEEALAASLDLPDEATESQRAAADALRLAASGRPHRKRSADETSGDETRTDDRAGSEQPPDGPFGRPRAWFGRLSRRRRVAVFVPAALIVLVYWGFGRFERAAHQSAYRDVEQLHRELEQLRQSNSDPADWDRFADAYYERRRRILARVQGAPVGSAGNHVAGAVQLLETLLSVSRKSQLRSNSQLALSQQSAERRFRSYMRQARRDLPLTESP